MTRTDQPNPVFKAAGLLVAALTVWLAFAASPAAAQSAIRDAEIEELLRDYSDPLFLSAGLHPESVNIYIINDPSLNAFVAGGQNMFIHTGLILASDEPNELIGVIAHETGHIAGGHLARSSDAIASASLPAYIGTALGLALLVAGAPEAGMAIMMGGQHIAQREFLAYSRVQEASADQAALNYLEATEQSGRGLLAFFDRFRDQEALMGVNQDPFIRSHPLNQERIALLQQRIGTSQYSEAEDSPESVRRLRLVQAKIVGYLQSHSYVMRRYPETDTSEYALYARSVALFRRGETDRAIENIDQLIAGDPENPYFHELRGQILFEGGRTRPAIESHRQSVELSPYSPLLRVNLGQALLASEEDRGNTSTNQEALRHLQFATIHDESSAFAWHQLSLAYARAGNEGMADLSIAELHYSVRNRQDALEFAIRARDKLPEESVHWMRAMDILEWAAPDRRARDELRRQRGLSLSFEVTGGAGTGQ